MPCQKSSDCPKKAPKRIDICGVMERLPWTISLIKHCMPIRIGNVWSALGFWKYPEAFR